MPFSFESMYRLVWGGIGISIHVFSLWFYVLFCVRIYRYIYLPPWTYPLFGARVDHMVQIPHDSQLNKIRILFNSPSLYTHIYPYTTAHHCIPCIHRTAYPLHLPLKPGYHTMHKRIQARIRTTAYTVPHSQAPDHGRAVPGKARKSADTGRSSTRLIWYKPQFLYPLYHFTTLQLYHFTQKKSPP